MINCGGGFMLKYYTELDSEQYISVKSLFSFESVNVRLPNCYYINDDGILYNGMGKMVIKRQI